MLYESFQYCLEARRRQHMRQHDENEKNDSQNLSKWQVFVEFLNFFREAQGQLKLCFMMFFDVLELWEPSWNDSGSTLDHSFFHDFSQNFGLNKSTLNAASTWPEWIDLSVCSVIPN